MIPKLTLSVLAGLLLGACSETSSPERVVGGGFETSDLQVVAMDSSSTVLVGARIWILDNQTDSTEVPTALDSARSDSAGTSFFRMRDSNRTRIGLEAWSGDSLVGILRKVDIVHGRPIHIVLRRARVLQLPCSTAVRGGAYFLQGSHLPVVPPDVCVDSFSILVPPGPWNLIAPQGGGQGPRVIPFQGDTLPPFLPPPPPGTPVLQQSGQGSGTGTGTGNGMGTGNGSGSGSATTTP